MKGQKGVKGGRRAQLCLCIVATLVLAACGPNRAQWMARAANQQAKVATSEIGSVQTVRAQARQAASLLNSLAAAAESNPPAGKQQIALAFARDLAEVSSGLQAIAESQTNAGFTNAIFAMCEPARQAASSRVGRVMMGIAAGLRSHPPANVSPEQRQSDINYFETFGGRLIDIPTRCEQARNAMGQASAQEQQAEAQHQANVNRTLTAALVVFAGTALVAGEVGSAAATRPPVTYQNNYYYGQ